ncbi:MAG TPA: phosphotransferase [Patescibacteria group bacterium]|nr:phosphotransferase [Patescibacteria group bacterium]
MDEDSQIQDLPCWSGPVTVEPLTGGITNRNFLVNDAGKKYVVRLGGDIPVHHVMRFNEHAASRAAADAGISPNVVYSAPGVLVIDFIEGKTADAAMVREHMDEIVDLVHRAHDEVTEHLRGPALSFWVFHVIRDYVAALREAGNSSPDLQDFLERADELEKAVGDVELVFAHNDLLAANFLNDGQRWWLIDWDYAGFNSPLFDLGGLASNNEFSEPEEKHMLERYFGQAADPALWKQYQAMKTASLLRETLWSMVSEIHSKLDFDYKTYTRTNKQRFEQAWNGFKQS